MLRLVLPKGSLEQATLELFADADLNVRRMSKVDYRATIEDPRISRTLPTRRAAASRTRWKWPVSVETTRRAP